MTEPENFFERWSRRKRLAAETAAPEEDEIASQEKKDVAQSPAADELKAAPQTEPLDLAGLPSIDSIDANTDVRAFLLPGVPPELTRAALRRAWSTDPTIRDFVGLVENGWDFNDPNVMAGFGSIAAEDVARLLTQAIGALPMDAATRTLEPLPPAPAVGENQSLAAKSESEQQLPKDEHATGHDFAPRNKATDVQRSECNVASQDKSRE